MSINRKEVERVIDDFETKARKFHDEAEEKLKTGDYEEVVRLDRKAHTFEYCAMIVRQLL